ncbi:hypothetical protein BDV97DRAFT_84356 [Delphinella strobiligena]|nr:hypothetical protein BDV97DRAFT_84356 [Delphinella strobiligena]
MNHHWHIRRLCIARLLFPNDRDCQSLESPVIPAMNLPQAATHSEVANVVLASGIYESDSTIEIRLKHQVRLHESISTMHSSWEIPRLMKSKPQALTCRPSLDLPYHKRRIISCCLWLFVQSIKTSSKANTGIGILRPRKFNRILEDCPLYHGSTPLTQSVIFLGLVVCLWRRLRYSHSESLIVERSSSLFIHTCCSDWQFSLKTKSFSLV